MIPEPWPIPPVRTPLEVEARLPDFDVQELFGTEDLAGTKLTSGPQLKWATQNEFPSVVRVVRTQLLRDSTHSGWGRRPWGCVVDVPLAGGPSGAAHPSDSCAVVFIEIAADLESQLENCSEVPGNPSDFRRDGRAATFRRWSELLHGREVQLS